MLDETTLRLIDLHLPELHKDRWAQTAAELSRRLGVAEGAERDEVIRLIGLHRADRHRPETSRAAILRQAEINAEARHGR